MTEFEAAALSELRAQTALLRRLVDGQATTAPPLADRFLAAAHRALGAAPFDAATLVRLAQQPLSSRRDLCGCVREVVDDVHAPGAGRRLGRWLARHRGYLTASEFRLENLRETRAGAAWRVLPPAGFDGKTRDSDDASVLLTEWIRRGTDPA